MIKRTQPSLLFCAGLVLISYSATVFVLIGRPHEMGFSELIFLLMFTSHFHWSCLQWIDVAHETHTGAHS